MDWVIDVSELSNIRLPIERAMGNFSMLSDLQKTL
jgi:hypothetical protein